MTQTQPKYRYIGIVGMPLSGKDTCTEYLVENFDYSEIKMSAVVAEELKKRLGREPTRKDLQEMGLILRAEGGRGAVAKKIIEAWVPRVDPSKHRYIFNGIRSLEEVECFRKEYGEDFCLIAICASFKIRYNRAKYRKRAGFDTFGIDEFRELDLRELRLGLGEALAIADHYIVNEGTKEELISNLKRILLDP